MADEQDRERASLPELHYIDRRSLPNFEIDGQPARIHTQGLFVTDQHYYVTGRLERNPKRPLLVRFDRANPSMVDYVDLLIAAGANAAGDLAFDHPGGFDFDGDSYWIPVAISRPSSKTLIMKVRPEPGKPMVATKARTVLHLDDHLGAIACDRTTGRLYGANWDTKLVYVWSQDGTLVDTIAQTKLLPTNTDPAFAVQDWKGVGNQIILAAASDKSSLRTPLDSKAALLLIDMGDKRDAGLRRLISPPGRDVLLTREGMAVRNDNVYFLPADLGTNAEVFRYRWSKAPDWSK
jgi:hypothetical protein